MLCTLLLTGASKPKSITISDNPTIADALEIFKSLANMKSVYDKVETKPTINDALEVLKYLAGMGILLNIPEPVKTFDVFEMRGNPPRQTFFDDGISYEKWQKERLERLAPLLIEEKQFHDAKVNAIVSAKKIDKIEIRQFDKTIEKMLYFETTDTNIISKWVDLVGKIKVTAVSTGRQIGSPPGIYFYIDGRPLYLGNMSSGHIDIDGKNWLDISLRIDNFSKLSEIFIDVRKEMGIPEHLIWD